jgi:LmbE family N-acetylglucosaminyl deacetylase
LDSKKVALVVAHPDDETLWAGGTVLIHEDWQWYIVCLCRGKDTDRAPKFYKALEVLKSKGIMGDLDDGPDQSPLEELLVEQTILHLLPPGNFDLVVSHSPAGEYTKHLRHEETGKAIINLWHAGKISADCLWTFAYEDGLGKYYPRPVTSATKNITLTERIWL